MARTLQDRHTRLTVPLEQENIEFGLFPSPADERLHNLLDSTSRTSRWILNMFNARFFSANVYHDIQSGIPDRIWNNSVLQRFKKLENDNHQWDMRGSPFHTRLLHALLEITPPRGTKISHLSRILVRGTVE
jgi:hypothetical protein